MPCFFKKTGWQSLYMAKWTLIYVSYFCEVLHGISMALIYHLMFFSLPGNTYYILYVISIFYIQRFIFHRKSDKFGGYFENSLTLQGSLGSLVPTPGDPWHLVEPEQRQVSRRVVVRIIEGKSRAEALLKPALPAGFKPSPPPKKKYQIKNPRVNHWFPFFTFNFFLNLPHHIFNHHQLVPKMSYMILTSVTKTFQNMLVFQIIDWGKGWFWH